MVDISVIVCTHNPRRDYLQRVLDALNAQTLSKTAWELLIVDNASGETLAETWDVSWHPRGRHIREDKLGLTPARLRGIAEARGELLVFFDDDNIPVPDFLEQALVINDQYPHLAVFGSGTLEPEFEVEPPPEILPHLHLLALRRVPATRWSNNDGDFESIPWGAGLCVIRPLASTYHEFVGGLDPTIPLDRKGDDLFFGGDDLFSSVAASVGYGFGVFPQLSVTHLIDARRLSPQYFLRLIQGHAFSSAIRHYLIGGSQPHRIEWFEYIHFVLHGLRHGLYSMRCQWAMAGGEDSAYRFILEKRLCSLQVAGTTGLDEARQVRLKATSTL